MKSASMSRNYRTWVAIGLISLGVGIFARTVYIKYQEYRLAKIRMEMQANILEGATAQPDVIKVDYARQTGIGSPLVFGGSHAPKLEHQDAWNKIADAGVTMMRKDLFLEDHLPKKITLEDYKNNKKQVQDTANWDQANVQKIDSFYVNAKKRGMKTIGIMSFAPAWLTYSNSFYGVPKDWDVYEDIVKKVYKLHRNNLDYIELWNEPNLSVFLNTKNSNIDATQAYISIYKHAAHAIREVDTEINDGKRISLGGPVSFIPNDKKILEAMLNDDEVRKSIDFISIHNYEHIPEPSWLDYRNMLDQHDMKNTPIFMTEWSHTPNIKKNDPYVMTDKSIFYTGDKLLTYYKGGIFAANYFSLQEIEPNSAWGNVGMLGYYYWINNKAELLPAVKTWTLLSKTLQLGKSPAKVMFSETDSNLTHVGVKTVDGIYEIAVVNKSDTPQLLELQLSNLNIKKRARVYVYIASKDYDGTKPVRSELAEVKATNLKTRFYMQEQAVAGIIIKQFNDTWFDFFDGITNSK